MLVEQLIVGGVVSRTVTVNVQFVGPPALAAVQVTLLTPRRKPVPLGGTHVTGTGPFAFVAVTLKVTGVSAPMHSAMRLVGQLITVGPVRPGKMGVVVSIERRKAISWARCAALATKWWRTPPLPSCEPSRT